MDASEKNPRSAGNVRANAAHERRKLKNATLGITPPEPLPVPSASIPSSDPKVLAAERNARERFGEFVESFELRDPTDTFAVKAAFRDDFGLEHLWVRVLDIDGEHLTGTLDNRPHNLKSLRQGQPVKVPKNLVHDWLILTDGQMLGGFTLALGGG